MIEPGYETCIFGELFFAAPTDGLARRALTAWRAARLDPEAIEDWPEAFQHVGSGRGSFTGREDDDEAATVGQWLDDCARYERSGARHFLEFTEGTGTIRVRGFLGEEDFDAYRRHLVTMFRLASVCGGRGSLTLVSKPWQRFVLGYRVEVTPEGSTLAPLPEDAVGQLPDRASLDEIVARVKASPPERAISETRASLPRL
jgi:hypothetical protein